MYISTKKLQRLLRLFSYNIPYGRLDQIWPSVFKSISFSMNWPLVYDIIYFVVIALICLRVVYDTRSSTKTLAYLLLVLFIPFFGAFFYLFFGTNYRKRKIYSKKLIEDDGLSRQLREDIVKYSAHSLEEANSAIESNKELAIMLLNDNMSPLTSDNQIKLLINGENKFPDVLAALANAKDHIHIEYYIFEDGQVGRAIANILIQKATEGVTVRFIYDDFGSRSIRKKMVSQLKHAGVHAFPFYKVLFIATANRVNYRNHRKIIVIDGQIGFVGGINVSDRYVNQSTGNGQVYWRDTHLRIEGPGVMYLQHLFLCDWNFCANDQVQPSERYFPKPSSFQNKGDKVVQIAASGPDSDQPTILFSILQAINLAASEILITTPYFIPGDSILDALIISALGGVSVKLLVPGISDSIIVNAAARSYYYELLAAGVEIYRYKKGFVHAKTLVADKKIAIIGTANMDYRSFDLNFEVNAIVYDGETGASLSRVFYEDLANAEQIDPLQWASRPWYKQLLERVARLISPLL